MGLCGGDVPEAPDMQPMADASLEAAKIAQATARENLDWAKKQDQMNRATLEEVLGIQLPIMVENFKNAMEDRQRYEQKFLPWEDDLMEEARNYASPERIAQERGKAIADVNTAFDSQRQQALSRLESYGIDPSETRNQALDLGVRVEQAKAQAMAANQAGERTEAMGRALRSDILNIGKGMPSQVAQTYGTSLNAGNSAVQGGNATTGTSASALQGANSYMQTGLQGINQGANITNMGYQNQLSQWQAQQASSPMSAIMDIAGMGVSAYTGGLFGGAEGGDTPAPPGELASTPQPGDTIPAMLQPGEYVIDADTVRRKGTDFFDKLRQQAAEKRMEEEQQKKQQALQLSQEVASGRPQALAIGQGNGSV